jgi:hypothetical protein
VPDDGVAIPEELDVELVRVANDFTIDEDLRDMSREATEEANDRLHGERGSNDKQEVHSVCVVVDIVVEVTRHRFVEHHDVGLDEARRGMLVNAGRRGPDCMAETLRWRGADGTQRNDAAENFVLNFCDGPSSSTFQARTCIERAVALYEPRDSRLALQGVDILGVHAKQPAVALQSGEKAVREGGSEAAGEDLVREGVERAWVPFEEGRREHVGRVVETIGSQAGIDPIGGTEIRDTTGDGYACPGENDDVAGTRDERDGVIEGRKTRDSQPGVPRLGEFVHDVVKEGPEDSRRKQRVGHVKAETADDGFWRHATAPKRPEPGPQPDFVKPAGDDRFRTTRVRGLREI